MSFASVTCPGKQASSPHAYFKSIAYASFAPTESSFFVRIKFGTWVKPYRVAGSAPIISMFRSLSMSPMRRGSSMDALYRLVGRPTRLSTLRNSLRIFGLVGVVCGATQQWCQHLLEACNQVIGFPSALGEVFDLLILDGDL